MFWDSTKDSLFETLEVIRGEWIHVVLKFLLFLVHD